MDTPARAKAVRWAIDDSFVSTSSISTMSASPARASSTLAFINAQLVAHGFAKSPGLRLDGLGYGEQESAAKCLLGMLSQRMDDLSRSEELSTKLRTLTYDHQRLQSIHEVSREGEANAEREMELAKSKMNAALKSLTTSEQAHKQTSATLSKTQSALQFNKSTAQNEIKRKEKEVEKNLERWGKICNEQARLGSTGSGLVCANLAAESDAPIPRDHDIIEHTLKTSEEAQTRLSNENEAFREVILSCARKLQTTLQIFEGPDTEVHSLITPPQLFNHNANPSLYNPAAHALNAHAKLREMVELVQTKIEGLRDEYLEKLRRGTGLDGSRAEDDPLVTETTQLKNQVESLKAELARMKALNAKEAQRKSKREEDWTVNMLNDLEAREKTLKEEKDGIVESLTRLQQERNDLDAARSQFAEEQRERRFQQMFSNVPDTPDSQRGEEDDGAIQPRGGRLRRVRRSSRISLDSSIQQESNDVDADKSTPAELTSSTPSAESLAPIRPEPARQQAKKVKSVAFQESKLKPVASRSNPTKSPPVPTVVPPESPVALEEDTIEYVPRNDDLPATASQIPQPQSQPPPTLTPPQPSTNPFDEVVLRSVTRTRPVFAAAFDAAPLPELAGLSLFPDDDAPSQSNHASGSTTPGAIVEPMPSSSQTEAPGPAAGSTQSQPLGSSGRSPRKSKGSSNKSTHQKPSPSKPRTRGENGEPVTPPIFTHRRIVGKKHQYAPAQPSPLSKMLQWTADSSVDSVGSDDLNEDGKQSNPSSDGPKLGIPQGKPMGAVKIFGVEEDDDWQAVDDDEELPLKKNGGPSESLMRTASSSIHQPAREQPPLTERELMPKPRRPIPSSIAAPKYRPSPKTKTVPTHSRPIAKTGRTIPPVIPVASSKGKEKENIVAANSAASKTSNRPLPSADKASSRVRTASGKVIMGKSVSKVVGGGANPSPTKPKLPAVGGPARRLRPPPTTGRGAKRT